MDSLQVQRRVQRVRHELRSRPVQVSRIESLGESFASITFSGEALADFHSAGFDDHIKFIFDSPAGEQVRRDYTPRRFDVHKRELTIEFALHGEGLASDWASQAKVGQSAVIAGPRGSMIVPLDYDWHLLVGDASALPAIARRLEELPAGSRALVLVEMADPAGRRHFDSRAQVELSWLDDAEQLVAAVEALELPEGEGFAWAAGEAAAMKRIRALLVEGKGHPKQAMRVAAYWRHGAAGFHEELGE
ncbi:siderophore-interacting protein [Pseudomonas sp. GCM10022188]|uniref:siderophore-interacting protein n=1 Tax=Pseudomonas TaxID=286 RepID=UPI001E3ABD04|nr:siderophore-interacting protein [Pseudomonas oryzagri]MCC6076535.1 siderophore-interacting protein [Pseudomonas oryzagri]